MKLSAKLTLASAKLRCAGALINRSSPTTMYSVKVPATVPAPKGSCDVKVFLVSSTEPGVGMQDHSITYRPYGLGASFFYDTCGITAGN